MTDPIRVLIADDHPLFRDGLTAMLQTGDDTELTGAATDGLQAVELALHSQPDVVVMDLHMPGMDGIEATRRIVADSPHIAVLVLMDLQMPGMDGLEATQAIRALDGARAAVPIIAMTANAFEEDRQACLAAGMNAHVGKPIDPAQLVRALLAWVPRSGEAAASR